PHPGVAEPADELARHTRLAVVGRDDDTFPRRTGQQFVQLAVDFGVVAQSEDDSSLLRAGAAVAAYDMQGRPVHVATLPPEAARHMEAARLRCYCSPVRRVIRRNA